MSDLTTFGRYSNVDIGIGSRRFHSSEEKKRKKVEKVSNDVVTGNDWKSCAEGFDGLSWNVSNRKLQESKTRRRLILEAAAKIDALEEKQSSPLHIDFDSSEEDPAAGNLAHIQGWNTPEKQQQETPKKKRKQQQKKEKLQKSYNANYRYQEFNIESTELDSVSDIPIIDDESDNEETKSPYEINRSQSPTISEVSEKVDNDLNTGDANKSKGSNWLKNIQWHKTPAKCENFEEAIEDSAKKKKFKYEKDGLADRLQRILAREKSDIYFWHHKKTSSSADEDGSKVLTLQIEQTYTTGSLIRCSSTCIKFEGGDGEVGCFPGDKAILLIQKSLCRTIPSGLITVHAPWQKLKLSSGSLCIFCTRFSLETTETANIPKQLSDTISHSKQLVHNVKHSKIQTAMWKCPCLLDSKIAAANCPAVTKALDIEHFLHKCEEANASTAAHSTDIACHDSQHSTALQQVSLPPCFTQRGILYSIEQGGSWAVVSFTATVQRFSFSKQNPQPSPPCQSLQSSLLVQDELGALCLIQIASGCTGLTCWQQLLDNSPGDIYHFTELKVSQRTNRFRSPSLFSLIDILCQQTKAESQSEEENSQGSSIENTWWGKTPGFCYVLTAVAGQSECKLLRKDSTIYRAPCVTPIHEASAFGESCRLSVCGILVYYEDISPSNLRLYLVGELCKTQEDFLSPVILVWSGDMNISSDLDKLRSSCYVKITDAMSTKGQFMLDGFSRIQFQSNTTYDAVEVSYLPRLNDHCREQDFVIIEGNVCYVEESTACSWIECDHCGSDSLTHSNRWSLYCIKCQASVLNPVTRLQMDVKVECQNTNFSHITIKLLQEAIEGLLPNSSADEGYDVQSVLKRKIGPIPCIVIKRERCASSSTESSLILKQIRLLPHKLSN